MTFQKKMQMVLHSQLPSGFPTPLHSRGGLYQLEDNCCTEKEGPWGASVRKHHLVGEPRAQVRSLPVTMTLPFPGCQCGLGALLFGSVAQESCEHVL